MTYRTILVLLDSQASCAVRVAIAADLARRYDAHLIGLAPIDWRLSVTAVAGGWPIGDLSGIDLEYLHEQAHQVAQAFELQARQLGLGSFESRIDVGDISTMIVHARYADLIVAGQTDSTQHTLPIDLPEQAVLHGGKPVLIIPSQLTTAAPGAIGRTILLGWDGGRESARAASDALPLLRQAQRVVVLIAEAHGAADRHGDMPGADVGVWLSRHGVRVEVIRDTSTAAVGETLLLQATALNADLIVMGGYGHSRLREAVLGGTTRTILKTMNKPVFMAH